MKKAALAIFSHFAVLSLFGCGSEPVFIADQVKFRVNFTKRTLQISFGLNSEYQVQVSKEVPFAPLGMVFLNWNSTPAHNEIGTQLFASKDNLAGTYPTQDFQLFPNGSSLPKSIPSGEKLKAWKISDTTQKIEVSLFYGSDSGMLVGGALLSDQFHVAPKNLLATQEFKAANGSVEATISFLGPSKFGLGGLYFFGNFGSYPFEDPAAFRLDGEELTWSINATDPATIVNTGDGWWWKLYSTGDIIKNLIRAIQNFDGHTVF